MLRKALRILFFVIVLGMFTQPGLVFAATDTTASSAATPTPIASPLPTAAPLNLTLSPVSLNLEAKPGETISAPIKIRNNGTETEHLSLSFDTFKADSSGEKPQLLDANPNDAFMKWVSVDQPEISIEPGEWKTIRFTFSPPPEAALTYYYTILFNQAGAPTEVGQTNIKAAPAMLVLTNVVSPNAKKELQLESFSAAQPIVEFLPEEFQFKVKNDGNVHIAPSGTIFIDGQGQKDIAVLPINPGNSMVLPQTTRVLSVKWNEGFPHRDESGKLIWDASKLNQIRFGKYTAHLIMVYDNGDRDVPVESFISFWVIPWRVIIAFIAIPVAPALLVFILMKLRYRARKGTTV